MHNDSSQKHFHSVHKSKVAERSMISAEIAPEDWEKAEDREMEIHDARLIETATAPWFVGKYFLLCSVFPGFKTISASDSVWFNVIKLVNLTTVSPFRF